MKPLRPYLYNAYYNWLVDNDYTPYLLVNADYPNVDVPKEFVKDGKIILNVSPRSIGKYSISDEGIYFNARFQGILRDVYIPFGSAEAIYSQETGDGVMFQEEEYYKLNSDSEQTPPAKLQKTKQRRNSHLRLIK